MWKSTEIANSWMNLIVISYFTLYASTVLGLNVALVGTILMASKIFDGVTDVVAGYIIDNTNTRWGKGRPYEVAIIGVVISTVLLYPH